MTLILFLSLLVVVFLRSLLAVLMEMPLLRRAIAINSRLIRCTVASVPQIHPFPDVVSISQLLVLVCMPCADDDDKSAAIIIYICNYMYLHQRVSYLDRCRYSHRWDPPSVVAAPSLLCVHPWVACIHRCGRIADSSLREGRKAEMKVLRQGNRAWILHCIPYPLNYLPTNLPSSLMPLKLSTARMVLRWSSYLMKANPRDLLVSLSRTRLMSSTSPHWLITQMMSPSDSSNENPPARSLSSQSAQHIRQSISDNRKNACQTHAYSLTHSLTHYITHYITHSPRNTHALSL